MKKKELVRFFNPAKTALFLLRFIILTLFLGSQGLNASTYSGHTKLSLDLNDEISERHVNITNEKEETNLIFPPEPPLKDPAAFELQQREIRGRVTDKDGQALIGVSISVKETAIGTISDLNGNYSLLIPADAKTILFSYVGMESQEISLGIENIYNIILFESTIGLEEIVVVGYGTQKKASVVGAISQIDDTEIGRSGNTNITNAIAGKLSGVLTIQQTGQPGQDKAEIIIRGLSSWNTSAPLVLVDGVERDFSMLDPNEISTVSVLKDASATAVFGAKGANGVIIVTTKRGIVSKPKMDFSASYGIERATRIPEHISSYTTMSMLNVAYMNDGFFTNLIPQNVLEEYRNPSTPLNALRYPDNNWFELLTKEFAPTYNTNFNIRGGTKRVRYFGSLGYKHDGSYFKQYKKGIHDTSFFHKRFNYRANLDFDLTKSTQLSMNVGGQTGISNQPVTEPWRSLYFESESMYPAYFPEWVVQEVPDLYYPNASGIRFASPTAGQDNPYSLLNSGTFRRYTDSQLFTDLILNQKLDFILKGLSFRGKFALSTYYRNLSLATDYEFPQYQMYYERIGTDQNPWIRIGEANEVFNQPKLNFYIGGLQGDYYFNNYSEASLNYSTSFGKSSVTALALVNRQQQNIGTQFPFYNQALVGRATYDYSNKYLLEVNLGYTGSERFAPGNRYGFFPAAAVGWVISEENFFKNTIPWMNRLKLRYSDGLVGSDYADNRWLYMSEYRVVGGYIQEDAGANLNAQWEEARKRDIGLEVGILDNMFTFTVDLFDERRSKMLITPQSVTMLVASSFKERNLGRLKKHGIEVDIGFNKRIGENMNYYFKGIFAFNESRILFKDDLPYAPDYTKAAGKPLGAQLQGILLTGTGYYTSVDDIHNNVAPLSIEKMKVGDYKFIDYNADGAVTNTDLFPIEGNLYPPITYSLIGGFTYKKFDFSFLLHGNQGKYVDFNQVWQVEFLRDNSIRVHKAALNYWRPDNPGATHSTLHWPGSSGAEILSWGGGSSHAGYNMRIVDRFWRKADYLRLKEIYAGYTFDTNGLNRLMGISNLNIFAKAENVFTITSLIEGDPERKDFYLGFYPIMSSYIFGMKFNF